MFGVGMLRLVLGISLVCWACPGWAAEGNTAAGPVGGTDMRSAFLPPPGLYGVVISTRPSTRQVNDNNGQPRAGLDAVNISAITAGTALLYVPEFRLFGGSIGLLGVAGVGRLCGQIVSANPPRCKSGFGDPYVEVSWSRFFGFTRPSSDSTAPPIREGLAVGAGLGAVLPFGAYDQRLQASNGITAGNNTWVIAPSMSFTYTTPPLIAEGTEFSSKIYLNNYFTNPATNYKSGTLVNIDFAITEHIGRWQLGVAGYYLTQIADDRRNGVVVAPDGKRAEVLSLGGVVSYAIPEARASIKFKTRTAVFAYNSSMPTNFILSFSKKLY